MREQNSFFRAMKVQCIGRPEDDDKAKVLRVQNLRP
jgi:hypothetical protein